MSIFPNSQWCLRAFFRVGLMVVAILIGLKTSYSQYVVNFEGTGETKTAYASGTVNLSGLDWDMTEALIGNQTGDIKNGARAARIRLNSGVYGTMTMLQNKSGGIGTVSFYYSRSDFANDRTGTSPTFVVEYSTDNGTNWIQVGDETSLAGINSLTLFQADASVEGEARIRIRQTGGDSGKRWNVDDITLSDYSCDTEITSFSPSSGPVGTVVTITGNSISTATSVTFAGVSASFSVIDENSIEALVPANAVTGRIRVFSECWATSASNFNVINYSGTCGSDGANLINENIQSWTSQTTYGDYTQTISAGDVEIVNCMVYPAGTGTGCSNGFIQVRAEDGIVELPPLNSVGSVTFSINAFADNRSVYLQRYIGGTWENLTLFADINETCSDYTYHVNSASTDVRLRIANASNPVKIHHISVNAFIAPTLQITSHPANQKVCNNANVTFSVTASGATGYQWFQLNDLGNWVEIAGETASSLTLSNVSLDMHGNQYYCEVTDGTCTYFSNAAQLSVIPVGTISVVGNSTICNNETAQLSIGYLRVEPNFTISIRLDGTEEISFNEATVPADNPFTYTTEPLVWEGPADTKERVYSVIITSDGCISDEVDVTFDVVRTLTPTITPLP